MSAYRCTRTSCTTNESREFSTLPTALQAAAVASRAMVTNRMTAVYFFCFFPLDAVVVVEKGRHEPSSGISLSRWKRAALLLGYSIE